MPSSLNYTRLRKTPNLQRNNPPSILQNQELRTQTTWEGPNGQGAPQAQKRNHQPGHQKIWEEETQALPTQERKEGVNSNLEKGCRRVARALQPRADTMRSDRPKSNGDFWFYPRPFPLNRRKRINHHWKFNAALSIAAAKSGLSQPHPR